MTIRPYTITDLQACAIAEDRLGLIVKPLKVQPEFSGGVAGGVTTPSPVSVAIYPDVLGGVGGHYQPSPFYSGDLLWCREAYIGAYAYEVREYKPKDWGNKSMWFPADGPIPERFVDQFWHKARSPVTMPKWASRTTLRVLSVDVKRVQYITEDEVRQAGILAQVNAHCGPLVNCYGPECPVDPARSCNAHGCWGVREDFALAFKGWTANPWCAFGRVEVINKNVEDVK